MNRHRDGIEARLEKGLMIFREFGPIAQNKQENIDQDEPNKLVAPHEVPLLSQLGFGRPRDSKVLAKLRME